MNAKKRYASIEQAIFNVPKDEEKKKKKKRWINRQLQKNR